MKIKYQLIVMRVIFVNYFGENINYIVIIILIINQN